MQLLKAEAASRHEMLCLPALHMSHRQQLCGACQENQLHWVDTKVRLPRNQLAKGSQKHLLQNDRFIADMSCTSQCQAKQHQDDSRCDNASG